MNGGTTDAMRALAAGDFTETAAGFARAGFAVQLPERGILQISRPQQASGRLRLLISVGIHGDETAPIEMLAHLLAGLARAPHELVVDLMVVVGNPAAIAQGRRYLDTDLNRLFGGGRSGLPQAVETRRAQAIMRASTAFFARPGGAKWHLDLHTAIRASLYPTFAVIPDVLTQPERQALSAWLGGAGIGAVIFNRLPAATFSAYTAVQLGATSCTAELGQVAAFGNNDLTLFNATRAALDALLRSRQPQALHQDLPVLFDVAQELVKHSAAFDMRFDGASKNFAPVAPGSIIARDGDIVYRTGSVTEYLVFPNPDVGLGQRAGLTVVRQDVER